VTENLSPQRVFLFSGHMIDRADRPKPRFPPEREAAVTATLAAQLGRLQADARDLGICGGACGGDLIFAECILASGARLDVYLPFEPEVFVRESVDFADANWRERFDAVRAHERARTFVLGATRTEDERNASPYERNNLWMLERALAGGAPKVHFLCVWDGKPGDGPGGAGHMVKAVEASGGTAEPPIDPLGSAG